MRTSKAVNLGRLVETFKTSGAYFQRAALVSALSFTFFLAMMTAFYIRSWPGYFGLATAFLAVNIFTLIGIWMQKKNVVRVFENGLAYRNGRIRWNEVNGIKYTRNSGLVISHNGGESLNLPPSIESLPRLTELIRSSVEKARK